MDCWNNKDKKTHKNLSPSKDKSNHVKDSGEGDRRVMIQFYKVLQMLGWKYVQGSKQTPRKKWSILFVGKESSGTSCLIVVLP